MTYAEALDMAAKAAGWRDWKEAHERTWELDGMRAHAATIMENAENARLLSMSAEREVNLRGELLRLQRKNAALKAERIRGGEMVKEAAAKAFVNQMERGDISPWLALQGVLYVIRALSVPAIVEAGDGDL